VYCALVSVGVGRGGWVLGAPVHLCSSSVLLNIHQQVGAFTLDTIDSCIQQGVLVEIRLTRHLARGFKTNYRGRSVGRRHVTKWC